LPEGEANVKAFILKVLEVIAALIAGPKQQPAPAQKPVPAPPKSAPVKALTAKAWMDWIIREATDGIEEEPNKDNRGPKINEYIKIAKCGSPGDPYCAIGMNAALEQAGIHGTRSAMARSFERNPNFIRLSGPAYGAITTFWRGKKSSGFGHVGGYAGETANHVYVWGFNQHDDANMSPFPKDGTSFGLVDYWWPKSVPLPAIKPIILDGRGKPVSLKVT
jgi:hypothetical protein